MDATLAMVPHLLDRLADPSPDATKAVAELAMAADFLCQAHGARAELISLADRLAVRLCSDAHLSLLNNPFLLGQALTPYVFLRGLGVRLPVWERVMAVGLGVDDGLREATPYRRMERQYLRAKAGLQPLPGWRGAPILRDARRAWAFNRDLSYAFSHVVLFATDFAAVPRPDPFVRGVGVLLFAEACGRRDVDLAWELALCLLTQDLSPADLADVVAACAALGDGFDDLVLPEKITATYHPVLVHDILCARLWQHHRLRLDRAAAANPMPPRLAGLEAFRKALAAKDAGAMQRAHDALPGEDWSRAMLHDRLEDLRRQSRGRILFLRETQGAEVDGPLYPDYARQIRTLLTAAG